MAPFINVTSGAAVCVRTAVLKSFYGEFKVIERRTLCVTFHGAEEAKEAKSVAMTSPVMCENEGPAVSPTINM